MKLPLILGFMMMAQVISFKEKQQQFARVKSAYQEKEKIVRNYFSDGKDFDEKFNLFIRIFKQEKIVEVWIRPEGKTAFVRLTNYDFCATSGTLGPKRREGDLQIPEGIYYLNHFNPQSNFHLSLGISYPNASDKILSDKKQPGSAIYIHGNCVTIGCIPITDDKIKELYILAVEARNNGQKEIPIHIFPTKLDDAGMNSLVRIETSQATHAFWQNLKPIYDDFERTRQIKKIHVNRKGDYYF